MKIILPRNQTSRDASLNFLNKICFYKTNSSLLQNANCDVIVDSGVPQQDGECVSTIQIGETDHAAEGRRVSFCKIRFERLISLILTPDRSILLSLKGYLLMTGSSRHKTIARNANLLYLGYEMLLQILISIRAFKFRILLEQTLRL